LFQPLRRSGHQLTDLFMLEKDFRVSNSGGEFGWRLWVWILWSCFRFFHCFRFP
jgi:hypothetical protein